MNRKKIKLSIAGIFSFQAYLFFILNKKLLTKYVYLLIYLFLKLIYVYLVLILIYL